MRNERGITLIALVITIIVLLILAGISIAMLTGENGIITNANEAKSQSVYAEAKEQMSLAYMAVRAEIAAQMASNTTYSAITSIDNLVDVVENELSDTKVWTVSKSGTDTIVIRYTNTAITKDTIANGEPLLDGVVYGQIKLTTQSASFDFNTAAPSAS